MQMPQIPLTPKQLKIVGTVLAGAAYLVNAQTRKHETEAYIDKALEKRNVDAQLKTRETVRPVQN